MMKTDPNDMPGVVWALGELFFFFLHAISSLYIYIGYIYDIHKREKDGRVKQAQTMPDTSFGP